MRQWAEGILLLLQEDFELERVKREKQKCVEWVVGVGKLIFILPSDRSKDFIYLFNYFIGMYIALCTHGRQLMFHTNSIINAVGN